MAGAIEVPRFVRINHGHWVLLLAALPTLFSVVARRWRRKLSVLPRQVLRPRRR
jgi:hypothetical protein